MNWKYVILAVAVGGAAIFATQRHNVPALEVVAPVQGPAVQGVYATGTVEASVMMPIAPRSGARLMELNTDEGNKVVKGQVLAQLEDNDMQHALEEVRSREEFAKKDYERDLKLSTHKAVAQEVVEKAKADWQAAVAASHTAEAQLDFMKLQSPADGLIIKRDGEVGQLIPANQPVFWLSCCAPLRVSAEVDEEDIAQVVAGQKVLIRADAFPGKVFEGKVQAITPKGDPTARSYRVRIGFDGETPMLIGMTAEANIIIRETKDALLVPTPALRNNKLWVMREGKLKLVPVVIGAKNLQQVEVREGITPEDKIVLTPPATLAEGDAPAVTLVTQAK